MEPPQLAPLSPAAGRAGPAPVTTVGLACDRHSFTSLDTCLEFGEVWGSGWAAVPAQVSGGRTGSEPSGCLLPLRKLLLPASRILARVTGRWGLSLIQALHQFQNWAPASLACCLCGVHTCPCAVSFTFPKGHRAPDWCRALDSSSQGLKQGKTPSEGPSGLVWHSARRLTECGSGQAGAFTLAPFFCLPSR